MGRGKCQWFRKALNNVIPDPIRNPNATILDSGFRRNDGLVDQMSIFSEVP